MNISSIVIFIDDYIMLIKFYCSVSHS